MNNSSFVIALEAKKVIRKQTVKKKTKQEHQHVCFIPRFNRDRNMLVHPQYCLSRLGTDLLQCVIYESKFNLSNARRIGIEYMVSDRLYKLLPSDEKKLWHCHSKVIKPDDVWMDRRIMEKLEMEQLPNLAKTYGKFWSTWQVDEYNVIPLGMPSTAFMSPRTLNWIMGKTEMPTMISNA